MILLLVISVLAFLVYALTTIQRGLADAARRRDGLPDPPVQPPYERLLSWAGRNKKIIALGVIVLMVWISVKAWYAMAGIGITQGYQPDQPMAFSHKLHAGTMAINCLYCHSGAEKSKTAGVPSLNVCMNCHKGVRQGQTTGTTEIAKIYAALDYDPETQKHGNNPKPVQWGRVHNLPDLAYFNHSQHVKAGGLKCQTCHGEMQNDMTVAAQFAPLTMGWCIDCHRKTPVRREGNHYYDNYHALNMSKHGGDTTLTVEKAGGTECARCHY